jgi:SAM-dependent methyltransferase
VRKAQPAIEQLEAEGHFKGLICDAGCGFGDNGIYLAQKGYRVVGFDFSAEAIQIAQDRAGRNSKKNGVALKCGVTCQYCVMIALTFELFVAAKAGVAHLTEWVVADALNIQSSKLGGRLFDTILDSACLYPPPSLNGHIDSSIHRYRHRCMSTYIHVYMHACMHTCIKTIHTYTYTHVCVCVMGPGPKD